MQAQHVQPGSAGFARWAQLNSDVVTFLTAEDLDLEGSQFLADLAVRVRLGRILTQAQTDRVRDNVIRRAVRSRQEAAAPARPGDCPAPHGRHTIEGLIVEVTPIPGFHTEVEHKMTLDVATDAGTFRVYCTAPAPLLALVATPDDLVGRRARITVVLSPSANNPAYALGSAPRRAALLGEDATPGVLTGCRTS